MNEVITDRLPVIIDLILGPRALQMDLGALAS